MKKTLWCALFVLLAAACDEKVADQDGETQDDVIIPDTTKVLDLETIAVLESISEDGSILVFNGSTPLIESLAVNDVIAAGVHAMTPYGLLRKVTGILIEGDKTIVTTLQGTLKDAIQRAHVTLRKSYFPDDIHPEMLGEGDTIALFPEEAGIHYTVEDLVVFDMDGDEDTEHDQIILNGSLDVTPEFELEINIGWFTLESVAFRYVTTAEAHADISAFAFAASLEKEALIGSPIHLSPITFFIGILPVVIVPTITASIGIKGHVAFGIESSLDVREEYTVGLRWEAGAWSDFSDHEETITVVPPTLNAEAGLRAYIEGQLSVLLYGVVGPYVTMEPVYFGIDANIASHPNWELYAGYRIGLGIKADVFGYEELASYEVAEIISHQEVLASGDIIIECPDSRDCSGRECGPDPVCEESCGECDEGWTCNGDGICEEGCPPLHSTYACYEGDVTWFDACDEPNEIKQACLPSEVCLEDACVPCGGLGEPCCSDDSCEEALTCTPAGCMDDCSPDTHHSGCYEGDVYWFDACGYPNELIDDCTGSEVCMDAACVACGGEGQPCCEGEVCDVPLLCSDGTCRADCSPEHAEEGCHDGDVYWLDGCGEPSDLIDNCSSSEVCVEDHCEPCGGDGEPCCSDGYCDEGFSCDGDTDTCVESCFPEHDERGCQYGDAYWFDACGRLNDLIENCTGSTPYCYDGSCVECTDAAHCGTGQYCSSHLCRCRTPVTSELLLEINSCGDTVDLRCSGAGFSDYDVRYYLVRHCMLSNPPCSTSTLVADSSSPNFSGSEDSSACPANAFYVVYVCNNESGCVGSPPGACTTCGAGSNIVANPGDCP